MFSGAEPGFHIASFWTRPTITCTKPKPRRCSIWQSNGYIVVTYCVSRLPRALLNGTDVIIVTCESNPTEIDALRALCSRCAGIDASRWATLGRLKIAQAVALRITEESGAALEMFTIAPRLTPHVRHREKYVDVPVSAHHAFAFHANGQPARRIRTLRQFVLVLEHEQPERLDGYIIRGDFSRWIGDVFGDRALADELRALEQRHRLRSSGDTAPDMASVVRARYDLVDDDMQSFCGG